MIHHLHLKRTKERPNANWNRSGRSSANGRHNRKKPVDRSKRSVSKRRNSESVIVQLLLRIRRKLPNGRLLKNEDRNWLKRSSSALHPSHNNSSHRPIRVQNLAVQDLLRSCRLFKIIVDHQRIIRRQTRQKLLSNGFLNRNQTNLYVNHGSQGASHIKRTRQREDERTMRLLKNPALDQRWLRRNGNLTY